MHDLVDRTRKVVIFHRPGGATPDAYEQDLCNDCAPGPGEMAGTMRAVKKRKSKTHEQ